MQHYNKYNSEPRLERSFTATLVSGADVQKGLASIEKAYIEHVLMQARYNQSYAAHLLGVSRTTLRTKLKEYFGNKYID